MRRDRREAIALERLFVAQLPPKFGGDRLGIVQSKAKIYQELFEQGLAEKATIELGGRFPVIVTGWRLTPLGMLEYCMSCT